MVARSACCFLEVLFTTDLYLSTACSVVSERAWDRFAVIYRPVIAGFALSACRSKPLLVVGVGISVYNIATAPDKAKAVAEEAGACGGGCPRRKSRRRCRQCLWARSWNSLWCWGWRHSLTNRARAVTSRVADEKGPQGAQCLVVVPIRSGLVS